ncbi:MAG: hypothetical protein ACI4PE_04140 [Bacilli bacterium]
MKKIIFIFTFLFLLLPFSVNANEKVNVYLFYGDGCPHCSALEKYLDEEYSNDKDVKVYKYEVWNDADNQELWKKVEDVTGEEAKGVPYFVIGKEVFQGYSAGDVWEKKVDDAIKKAKKTDYNDNVGITLGLVKGKVIKDDDTSKPNYDPDKKEADISDYYNNDSDTNTELNIPVIGTVNLKDMSIPVIAILIGLVDGFNPCAMWVLIFLITMLFDYPSRKKMWILGCTFLFTSAFIYFLFMISFLKVATFINSINILKLLIAVFALVFGGFNIYRYFKTKDVGCDVVDKNKRRKIINRIKNILSSKSFALAIGGIVLLAISVNLIELLCSMGLPVMFTEILAYNNITGVKNILYIILYIIFFLIDDLIVFFIAMKTLKITAISNKYSKYSHLIGGLIMIAIGLLMILKPEWLMFNF